MAWIQLTLTVARAQAPLVEAALEGAGALAVTLGDAGDDPLLEPGPGETPLWQGVKVTGLFADDPQARARVAGLAESLATRGLAPPVIESIADRVWERVWLDDFRPARFGRRLWVCPRGEPAPAPDAVVVDLDPGLAFGTGHHPTTALCLEWLDGADLAGRTVLDYGCGSGILAIAALKLGAARALAVDHDPQAVAATRDNAARNGVAPRLRACLPSEIGDPAAELPADIAVANILAGPLVELAPTLLRRLRPGGLLALSGLLAGQVPAVAGAYAGRIDLEPPVFREEWALLWGRAPKAPSGAPEPNAHTPEGRPCP